MSAGPETLGAPLEPSQAMQRNSIHTASSSWVARPDVSETKPFNDTRAIASDRNMSNAMAEDSGQIASERYADSGVKYRNRQSKVDLSPPQPCVTVNGQIINPTADSIRTVPSTREFTTRNNDGLARRASVKTIKEEGQAAAELLKAKIREFQCMKEITRQLEKDESSAFSGHQAAVRAERSTGLALLAAKAKHESSLIDLSSKESKLRTCRERALQQSELMKQKQEEVEELKRRKGTEDRERRLRIKEQKKRQI